MAKSNAEWERHLQQITEPCDPLVTEPNSGGPRYYCVICGRKAFSYYSSTSSHWCRSCRYQRFDEYFGKDGIEKRGGS